MLVGVSMRTPGTDPQRDCWYDRTTRVSVPQMWLGRMRTATSDGARACIIIVIVVAAINLWKLGAGLDADPVLHRAGLSVAQDAGILPGEHTIDPNDGYTLQALARASAEQWLDGDAPYWNRFEGVGAPLAGEMQSMALHPLVVLHRLPQGFLLGQIVMEALAGIATVFFLRRLGIGNAVSLGAGIAYACNGTFAWLSNAAASPVAYLPLLLWGVEIARDASMTVRRGGWALIAVAVAGSLYAGFPETAYINGLFVCIWCLVRLESLGRPSMYRFAGKLAAGVVAGVLLAAPVLLAFLDYFPRANVGGHTGALSTETLPPTSISALYMPYVYGPINAFTGNTTSGNLGEFWGRVGGYLSALQLMLAVLTIGIRRLRVMQLAVVAWLLVFVAKSYGFRPIVTPIITAVNWIPGMKQMAFFRYSQPSVAMALLVLAAFGAQRVLDERLSRRQVVVTVAAVAMLLLSMLVYARTETRHFVGAPRYRLYVLGSFVFAVGGAVVAAAVASAPRLRRRGAALASLVAIDAAVLFMVPQLSTDRMTDADTAPVTYLRQHLGLQRFYTLGPIAPNYGSYYGIASINQNDVPVPKSWSEYIVTHLDSNADPLVFTGYTRVDPNGPAAFFQFVDNLPNFAADRHEVPRDQHRSADGGTIGRGWASTCVRRWPHLDLRASRCRRLLPGARSGLHRDRRQLASRRRAVRPPHHARPPRARRPRLVGDTQRRRRHGVHPRRDLPVGRRTRRFDSRDVPVRPPANLAGMAGRGRRRAVDGELDVDLPMGSDTWPRTRWPSRHPGVR